MTRLLVTGFEPFGGEGYNASAAALSLVSPSGNGWDEIVTAVLPVSFARAPRTLRSLIKRHRPNAVICFGEAGGRARVTPELWAVNTADARIPDNDAQQPRNTRLDDGPLRLPSRLDVPALVTELRAADIPAEISEDAGNFVCNAVFRAALTLFSGPSGFVHVPAVRPSGRAQIGAETSGETTPEEADMTIQEVARAVAVIAAATARPSPATPR